MHKEGLQRVAEAGAGMRQGVRLAVRCAVQLDEGVVAAPSIHNRRTGRFFNRPDSRLAHKLIIVRNLLDCVAEEVYHVIATLAAGRFLCT